MALEDFLALIESGYFEKQEIIRLLNSVRLLVYGFKKITEFYFCNINYPVSDYKTITKMLRMRCSHNLEN